MPFTKDELAAMAAADAEIEAGFVRTNEDLEFSRQLDREVKFAALDPEKRRIAAKCRRYYEAHREEINAKNRAYYEAHREEISAYYRAYYEAHREEIAAYQRAYHQAHREEIAARERAYREAHREEINARRRADYARKKAAQA